MSLSALMQVMEIAILIIANFLVAYSLISKQIDISKEVTSLDSLYDLNVLISISPIIYGDITYQSEGFNLPYLWIRGNAKLVTDYNVSDIRFIFGVTRQRLDFWASLAYLSYCSGGIFVAAAPLLCSTGIGCIVAGAGMASAGISGAALYFTGHDVDPNICFTDFPEGNIAYHLFKFFDKTIGNFFRWVASSINCGIFGNCNECHFPADNYYRGFYESLDWGTGEGTQCHLVVDENKQFYPILTLNPIFFLGISDKKSGFLSYFNYSHYNCQNGAFQNQCERALDNCKEVCGYEVLHVLKDIGKVEYKKYRGAYGLFYNINFERS